MNEGVYDLGKCVSCRNSISFFGHDNVVRFSFISQENKVPERCGWQCVELVYVWWGQPWSSIEEKAGDPRPPTFVAEADIIVNALRGFTMSFVRVLQRSETTSVTEKKIEEMRDRGKKEKTVRRTSRSELRDRGERKSTSPGETIIVSPN